jgi:hypothetical protein
MSNVETDRNGISIPLYIRSTLFLNYRTIQGRAASLQISIQHLRQAPFLSTPRNGLAIANIRSPSSPATGMISSLSSWCSKEIFWAVKVAVRATSMEARSLPLQPPPSRKQENCIAVPGVAQSRECILEEC